MGPGLGYGLAVFGFLRNWSQLGNLPAELRGWLRFRNGYSMPGRHG
jgi:hypothetical protein